MPEPTKAFKVMQVKHVLVPLDGSTLSERALPFGADQARLYGCPLTLLRARTVPMAVWQDGQIAIPPDDLELDRTREYLEGHAGRLRAQGLTVHAESPMGEPAEVILDFAAQKDVDLIVMTSHGLTGFKRWLYGSVAERVVRHAPCPTLIIGMETLRRLEGTPPEA